ncbi:MAG: NUDIX hydrolase [Thermoanaerobaculia bacterium]
MSALRDLLEEIRLYRPADDLESRHRDGILELLSMPASVASRGHYAPGHLTAGAFIVDPASRRLLLHHHRRLGRWLQMGGHFEPGESARETALRESIEESGLTDLAFLMPGIFDLDIHAIPAGKEPAHLHHDIRYLVETSAPDSIVRQVEESHDLAWFDLESAERILNEEGSHRVIAKIAGRLRE